MKKAGFSPATKRLLTCIAIILVVGMFVVRGILLNNGTIDEIVTHTPDEIQADLSKVQMTVTSGGQSGMCTAIDSFKNSTKEETFSTYLVTANHLIADPADITIIAADGTTYEGILHATDVSEDLAILLIHTEEEIEARYERDAIGRVAVDNTVYYQAPDGTLQTGTVMDSTDVEGDAYAVSGSYEDAMSGGALVDASGYYVGMITTGSADGTLTVMAGNNVHDAVKAAD